MTTFCCIFNYNNLNILKGRETSVLKVTKSVSPSSPQLEKLIPYILLLTIVVIALRRPYTKTEVGAVLELNDVY